MTLFRGKKLLQHFLMLGILSVLLTSCATNQDIQLTAEAAIVSIPSNCTSWFDGCNVCSVENSKLAACTRKMCFEDSQQPPKCLAFYNDEKKQVIPASCTLWFDGCNRCVVSNGEIKGCTKMACSLGKKLASTCLESQKPQTN